MKTSTPLALFVLGALLVAGLSGLAQAQDPETREGYRSIQARQFSAATAGGKYTLTYLKFNKLFETELKLYGGHRGKRPVRSRLAGALRVREGSDLHSKLLVRKDSEDRALVPKESNVQIFGTVRLEEGQRILEVDRVVVLGTQLERFTKLSEKLGPEDSKSRRDLVAQIEAETRFFASDRDALKAVRERLIAEARAIVLAKLPALPAGATRRIEVGLSQRDLGLLAEVWSHPEVSKEDREKAEAGLRKLRATRYHGEWVPLMELKEQLGFLVRERRWVRQERVWLEEAIEREKQRLANGQSRRDYTERDLMTSMKAGKVLRGMEKEWVIAARKSAGKAEIYPLRVSRVREKRDAQELVWELWVMPDGEQVYFFNGWVCERLEGDESEAAPGEDPQDTTHPDDSEERKTGE